MPDGVGACPYRPHAWIATGSPLRGSGGEHPVMRLLSPWPQRPDGQQHLHEARIVGEPLDLGGRGLRVGPGDDDARPQPRVAFEPLARAASR